MFVFQKIKNWWRGEPEETQDEPEDSNICNCSCSRDEARRGECTCLPNKHIVGRIYEHVHGRSELNRKYQRFYLDNPNELTDLRVPASVLGREGDPVKLAELHQSDRRQAADWIREQMQPRQTGEKKEGGCGCGGGKGKRAATADQVAEQRKRMQQRLASRRV